jgi:NADPH2:quinone reductase
MPTTISAIAAPHGGPLGPDSLIDVTIAAPTPGPRDLIVEVRAVSVNPVDTKVRASANPSDTERILGYDAAGIVVATGSDVTLFTVGDEVYYAGDIRRHGTNAALHAVDERIVGRKPSTLSFAEAAALPLTTITAWESLFDKLKLSTSSTGTILVFGGAGGVGSILIQLAKQLTGLTVIATAGRPESAAWSKRMGADHVVDRSQPLLPQLSAIAPRGVDYLFTPHSKGNAELFASIVRPLGEIVGIDEDRTFDLVALKGKSISWHWENMFVRPVHATDDLIAQHELLETVADLVDAGRIRSTLTESLSPLDAATLRQAHAKIETGHTIGKIVIERG